MIQRGRIFGDPRLVIGGAENQLDDRGHRAARLRLDAIVGQQIGIVVGAGAGDEREIIAKADGAIESGMAARFADPHAGRTIAG